jgi:signal peptidase I
MGATVLQPYRLVLVQGHSMDPLYGDRTLVISRPLDRPLKKGDVVVLDTDYGTLIKRVAYLGGDKILQYYDGLNWNNIVYLPKLKKLTSRFRWSTVPAGKVFVVGDNGPYSCDSRTLGFFNASSITRLVVSKKSLVALPGHEPSTAIPNWTFDGRTVKIIPPGV